MKSTEYYKKVAKKRHGIPDAWCMRAIVNSDYSERQKDGRWRYWKHIPEIGMYIRVVTLADGETVHNAFPDRNFKEVK